MQTLHELTADKLERDPSLLAIPLENIDRWLACGHTAPHRLEQWRAILLHAQASPEGLHQLLALLRDRDEATGRLRDFAPFAGVLTRQERHQSASPCAYNF